MRYCERCGAAFQSMRTCPRDGVATRADLSDPLLGRVIGDRYRILDRIAAGGMGQVYRAAHLRIASLFAVKVLYGDVAHDPAMRARFEREAEAASCLQSRHIVRVLDFGETTEGVAYLVMEHIDAPSLSGVIGRQGALPEPQAVGIARQIARGLLHAHERGIVHRDLKPDNVALVAEDDEQGIVKLLDFGLAQIRSGSKLTRAGQIFGTPEYMAPEQFLGRDMDARTDLYALGVILFEMLSGTIPFEAPTVQAFATAHLTAPPPPIRARNPSAAVSPGLEAIVARLMAKRPEDRFSSARAVIAALAGLEASPAPRASLAGSRRAVSPEALERIAAAIQAGAPTYNAGDHAGCLRIYVQTAERLLASDVPPGAAAARLAAALRRSAAARTASEGAWEMRYAFDDLAGVAARPLPLGVDASRMAAEIAVAEAMAAPRYAAGSVNLVADYYLELARQLAIVAGQGGANELRAGLERLAEAALRAGGGQRALAFVRDGLERLCAGALSGAPSSLPPASLPPSSLPSASLSPDECPGIDRIVARIAQAIGVGAPAYNAGDAAACYRVYRQTAEAILQELAGPGTCPRVASRLRAALEQARVLDPDQAAWAMRHAFDDVVASAARR